MWEVVRGEVGVSRSIQKGTRRQERRVRSRTSGPVTKNRGEEEEDPPDVADDRGVKWKRTRRIEDLENK